MLLIRLHAVYILLLICFFIQSTVMQYENLKVVRVFFIFKLLYQNLVEVRLAYWQTNSDGLIGSNI